MAVQLQKSAVGQICFFLFIYTYNRSLFWRKLYHQLKLFSELMNVGNSLWMIAACLFSIGPVEGVPRNMSGRVILAMWWFMILIVTAMYTANLAAFLTVTRMENGINSIVDLISQDKVKWGTVNGTNAQILLQAAKAPDLVEVYKKMVSGGRSVIIFHILYDWLNL